MINKNELPENWEITSLKAIASKIKDGSHNPPAAKSIGLPMISAKDVQNNKITFDKPRLISEEEFEIENRRTQIEADDVLLTIVATIGRTAVVPKIFKPFTLQRSVAVIKTNIDSGFLCYYFQSTYFQKQLTDSAKGTAQKGVYLKTLSELEIIVPPLAEQERIVAKIEELFSELDAGRTSLKTAARQLKTYRQAVLKWAFEGKLTNENVKEGELPDGWKWKPLVEIADKIFDGPFGSNLKSNDYVDEGVRVIRLENIGALEFKDEYKTYVTEDKYETIKKHTASSSDIIFSSFIADEIRVTILPKYIDRAINKADCFCVRTSEENINRKFLVFFLATKTLYNQLVNKVHGATRPRINTRQLKAILIPICSPKEQQRIVEEIESRLSVCDKLEETINKALAQSESLR